MSEPRETSPMRRPTGAIALIIIGAVLFALQFSRGPAEVIVFLVVGAALLFGYFQRKSYSMLIPGCILLGLGFGALGDRTGIDFDNFSSFGLGLGFLAIFIIDTIVRGRTHWWPLIPGGILLLTSVSDSPVIRVITKWWPLILVLVGVLLLLRNRGDSGTGGGPSGSDS